MGYRMQNIPKDDMPQRIFDVRNGATMKAAFACYYYRNHDTKLHDHIGWPRPGHPDESCQMFVEPAPWIPSHIAIEPHDLEEIHLTEEGYTGATIIFEDSTIGNAATATVQIDSEQDHIINLTVTVNLPTFTDEPKETGFTIFAIKNASTRDAVCHGVLRVLPGSQYV